MILCECGEFVGKNRFKDYIKTSQNPSTETFGHTKCGLIFNFVDDRSQKRYSSKVELKSIAKEFADKIEMGSEEIERFLLAIDRLKREGNLTDVMIITKAYESLVRPLE